MNAPKREWPGDGRLREALPRSFRPTIVFIHNYGGNRSSTHRHQDMVLDMGYNCFAFQLSRGFGRGTIAAYISELREVLDTLPGDKIIYSFSFPSVAAAAVIAGGRRDVKAWICDGGPFFDTWKCYWNLLTRWKRGNRLTRMLRTTYIWLAAGGLSYYAKVSGWLNRFDPRFPVLSIREERDVLVPEAAIAKFFACNPKLNLKVLRISGADHLEGLKRAPEEYKRTVRMFLDSVV